ncbi:hypothetical protein BDW22DRAFT_255984 [Trametopsis cervina]|nr:hypothetical protein BDW22DRAFT_255984 [Trametopsis cervina]
MHISALLPAVLSIGSALATTFNVTVGANGALAFSPSSLSNVSLGDVVAFQFVGGNHSVTQSSFGAPCQNLSSNGLDSGFQDITAGSNMAMEYSVTINDTSAPLWFYCRQTIPKNHCQTGMVFAVNPTPEKTFAAFQAAAMSGGNLTNTASASSSSSTSQPSGSASSAPAQSSGPASSSGSQPTDSTSPSTSPSSDTSSPSPSTTQPSSAGTVKAGMAMSMVLAGVAASLML